MLLPFYKQLGAVGSPFFFFLSHSFNRIGTTLSLKEEGFLSMLSRFKSLRMILAIIATCGLFSLHKKGEEKLSTRHRCVFFS